MYANISTYSIDCFVFMNIGNAYANCVRSGSSWKNISTTVPSISNGKIIFDGNETLNTGMYSYILIGK